MIFSTVLHLSENGVNLINLLLASVRHGGKKLPEGILAHGIGDIRYAGNQCFEGGLGFLNPQQLLQCHIHMEHPAMGRLVV